MEWNLHPYKAHSNSAENPFNVGILLTFGQTVQSFF